jgi:hypothetical protein
LQQNKTEAKTHTPRAWMTVGAPVMTPETVSIDMPAGKAGLQNTGMFNINQLPSGLSGLFDFLCSVT